MLNNIIFYTYIACMLAQIQIECIVFIYIFFKENVNQINITIQLINGVW